MATAEQEDYMSMIMDKSYRILLLMELLACTRQYKKPPTWAKFVFFHFVYNGTSGLNKHVNCLGCNLDIQDLIKGKVTYLI